MQKFSLILLFVVIFGCNKKENDYLKYYRSPGGRSNPTSLSPNDTRSRQTGEDAPHELTWEMVINSSYWKYLDQLQVEYEERMEANVKKYERMAKEMQKPQYSDPLYFGHKRKPKKRPLGKRKFCEECGIWH